MSSCDWTIEETTLLIQKRLELFGCARGDRVYDQISDYLYRVHNICQNPSACQSRFNNVLKTYRLCVKRIAEDGHNIRKMRFPFFDIFHQYYSKDKEEPKDQEASSQCKSEIIQEETSYAVDGDNGEEGYSLTIDSTLQTRDDSGQSLNIPSESDRDSDLLTPLPDNNNRLLEDLKLKLMEQKLLYFTNQNMLMQDKQEYYRQKEQERARGPSPDEEIPKVLRGIHSCLAKCMELKVIPPPTKKVVQKSNQVKTQSKPQKNVAQTDDFNQLIPIAEESEPRISSQEAAPKRPQMPQLKVRKNAPHPPWNRTQTVLLIKIHCDLRPTFNGINLFECIANKLMELHINRKPRDCRTRWNNLLRSYKECRLRLQQDDKAPVKFEYFDEIDAYYKDRQFDSLRWFDRNL